MVTPRVVLETDGEVTLAWPEVRRLKAGETLDIPAATGNYGYLRFDRELDVPLLLGSRSTNVAVGLGGYKGRALKAGDRLELSTPGTPAVVPRVEAGQGALRIIWGLHADLFGRRAAPAFRRDNLHRVDQPR